MRSNSVHPICQASAGTKVRIEGLTTSRSCIEAPTLAKSLALRWPLAWPAFQFSMHVRYVPQQIQMNEACAELSRCERKLAGIWSLRITPEGFPHTRTVLTLLFSHGIPSGVSGTQKFRYDVTSGFLVLGSSDMMSYQRMGLSVEGHLQLSEEEGGG